MEAEGKKLRKSKYGAGVRNPALRPPGNPDPIRGAVYVPLGPVNGQGGQNISGPYDVVLDWPAPLHPGEWNTGSARGVYAESPDRVIAVFGGEVPAHNRKGMWGRETFRDLRFMDSVYATPNSTSIVTQFRRCHEVVVYNREGKAVDNWDRWNNVLIQNEVDEGVDTQSGYINRIRVDRYDPKRHIWLVGVKNIGIFKLTNDGKTMAMKIDASNVPAEYHPFYYPQDIAFMPNGDLWVVHQHHLMKFSKDGKFIMAVGGQGQGPCEFDGIHDILVHPETFNLYLNDRANRRIQILDKDGKFLDQWQGFFGAYALRFTADLRHVWVANGILHKFFKYDMTGKLVPEATWGTFGISPGAIWGVHYFDTDVEGNLYVAEDYTGRVQKFRPIDGVDPAHPQLIGQLVR